MSTPAQAEKPRVSDEVKAKYKELKAKADAAYAAAEPLRDALRKALEPYHALTEEIDDLLDGEVETCEGCSDPIFAGEKYHQSSDGWLCVTCAPTFEDILQTPRNFLNAEEEPMTAEEAEALCRAHQEAGGSLTDSLAASIA